MTILVKTTDQDAIYIPVWLLRALNLREGDQIKAIVNGETLRLARINKFLELRGALANDAAFDQAIELMEQAWAKWTLPLSVSTPAR